MQTIELQTAGGVIFHDDLVLLIRSESRNSYSLPKGRVEPGESLEQTAIREVQEETGYFTKIVQLIDTMIFEFDKDGEHFRKSVAYYLLELADKSDPKPNLQEGEDFENFWVKPDEALGLLTYSDARDVLQQAISLKSGIVSA